MDKKRLPETMSADKELAPIKEQVYRDARPADTMTRYHARVRRAKPGPMYEAVRIVMTTLFVPLHRVRPIDVQNVPGAGPAIIVPNHFSFLDHFFVAFHLRRRVQFMAKSQLFKPPVSWIISPGGVFPVRRGERDEEAFITAHTILDRGGTVVMYAEGGRSRTGELGEPRPGVGRAALESGATVIPVAIYGSQYTRNFKRLRFPKVIVKYGEPLRFEQIDSPNRAQQLAASNVIFDRVKELFGSLRDGRVDE